MVESPQSVSTCASFPVAAPGIRRFQIKTKPRVRRSFALQLQRLTAAPPPTTRTSYLSFRIIPSHSTVLRMSTTERAKWGSRRRPNEPCAAESPESSGLSFGPFFWGSCRRSRPMCTSTMFVSGRNFVVAIAWKILARVSNGHPFASGNFEQTELVMAQIESNPVRHASQFDDEIKLQLSDAQRRPPHAALAGDRTEARCSESVSLSRVVVSIDRRFAGSRSTILSNALNSSE